MVYLDSSKPVLMLSFFLNGWCLSGPFIFPSITRFRPNSSVLVGFSNSISSTLIMDLLSLVIFIAWKMTLPLSTSNSLALIMEPSINVSLAFACVSISGTGSHSVSDSLARPAVIEPLFKVMFWNLNSSFTMTVQLLYKDELVNSDTSMMPSL